MRIGKWTRPGGEVGPAELVLRLTAIELLLRPMGPWFIKPFVLLLAGLALVAPQVLRAPVTWLALALLVAGRLIADWPLPDNHIYLLAYWCLAAGLALQAPDIRSPLALTARLLIGFAFFFAVSWKALLSPDYLDGRFFRVTLLTDERFADAVLLFGGLSQKQLAENRQYLEPLPEGAELLHPPELVEPAAFQALVLLSTWGTLLIEAAIAVLFLLKVRGALATARHALLLLFCVATYAFAPVAGFGWLLLVMGLAQCREQEIWLRRSYVTVYFLVLIYSEVPWAAVALRGLGPLG